MFVLLDEKTGGVYAVRDDDSVERVVQLFIDKDDADRYYEMLQVSGYPRLLEVKEVEEDAVKENCKNYGYRFTVITPNDIVIPPPL
tara:strand:+ start:374 stop:631 length:258 start_codon:yes stop_codon:yes gene_type:complete